MEFDVFLSHNSSDKPQVRVIAEALKKNGLKVWLDEWELPPGSLWQQALEAGLTASRTVAVLVGPAGVGRWEEPEILAAIDESTRRNKRLIPVLLPGASRAQIEDRAFLRQHMWVEFKGDLADPEPIERLIWGITMVKSGTDGDGAEAAARRLDEEVTAGTRACTERLGRWPEQSFAGEEIVEQLKGILKKVEASPEYREQHRAVWVTLYRMIGGAYLLHSKLEMGDKLRAALPPLRKSLELWPDQARLPENISLLEAFLKNSGGNIQEYLTTVLQIFRGPGDAQIPMLVEKLSAAAHEQSAARDD
jgi:hypothetical protein